jgi:hypothetical protein
MPVLDTTEANRLWAACLCIGTTPFITAGVSPVNVDLVTILGSDSGFGTPVSGGSYVKQAVAFATPASRATSNTSVVSYTLMPACTVVGIDSKDSSGTPVRKIYGPLGTIGSPVTKTVVAGDTISFAIGAIAASFG